MTLEEIQCSDKMFLTPADVAEVMGADPQYIRIAAHQNPALLGFPVSVIGTRTRIPRVRFLSWLLGDPPAPTKKRGRPASARK